MLKFVVSIISLSYITAGCATFHQITGPSREKSAEAWKQIDENNSGWSIVFPENEVCFNKEGQVIDDLSCKSLFEFKNKYMPRSNEWSDVRETSCFMIKGGVPDENVFNSKRCQEYCERKIKELSVKESFLAEEKMLYENFLPVSVSQYKNELDLAVKQLSGLIQATSLIISRNGLSLSQIENNRKTEEFITKNSSKYGLSLNEFRYLVVRSDGVDSWGKDLGSTIFSLENSKYFKIKSHRVSKKGGVKTFEIYLSKPYVEHEIKITFALSDKYAVLAEIVVGPEVVRGWKAEAALSTFVQ